MVRQDGHGGALAAHSYNTRSSDPTPYDSGSYDPTLLLSSRVVAHSGIGSDYDGVTRLM
jgi:hypothetical protein